jgi:hypothetical protein
MQTLFLLTFVLAGWRVANLDEEPTGAQAVIAATPTAPAPAAVAAAPPASAIPYRLVDGVDLPPKPKPKVRGVPAPRSQPQTRPQPQPMPPAQANVPRQVPYTNQAPVYVYVVAVPIQTGAQTNYAVEDAYYNPVFKGADQWHYDPWPEYLLYGQFWPADISFPYPLPPQSRYFYRYRPAYLYTLN